MLKSLEISGFKSFAKKTELQFKSKITAIVGPNGSGKSNVAESFRFVLGEQSMKSMRGKRGEDLIWNGSTEVGRANRASAKLTFDNKGNIFSLGDQKIDFEEIVIERVVSRDGSNEYRLNGSQVRLKDVLELLAQAHIGTSHHHIISQGEADRILSANMKERKGMIEDALGLKVYQYKKEESERKLEKTAENIKQVESLRREIAPHLKFLKKQVEKVEKAEELKNKLVEFYKDYLYREKLYIQNQKEILEKERSPITEKLNWLEQEMEKAKQILSNSTNKDKKSEELIGLENKIKAERTNKDNLYREMGKLEGELNANSRLIEKIENEQKVAENKMIPLKEVEDLETEIRNYLEIGQIIERIKNFILTHKNSGEHRDLKELRELDHKLNINKADLEEKIKETENILFELSAKHQQIEDSIEKDKDSNREAERAIFKISNEQSELHNKLNILDMEKKSIISTEEDWKREIQEGGILLGPTILRFEETEPTNQDEEPREKQLERRKELEKMKIRLEELGGGGGSEIMKEYQETVERDEFLTKELEDLKKSAESLQGLISDLTGKLDTEFKDGITKINKIFNEFFGLMFGGGTAELNVEKLKIKRSRDSIDLGENDESGSTEFGSILDTTENQEVEEGIEIAVSLPRKRIKGLDMLSGGERALTSIALLFAISQVNPPPFIILDETDAALDEANSKKYGDMIENLSKYSQLILITHNRETMSRAGVIYGVTMGRDGVSRLLSIAFDEAVAVAK